MGPITELFNHYGYVVLFVALTLELVALPTPGEALMAYCGFLAFQGKLNWAVSVIIATAGLVTGITIAYFVGRTLGSRFFRKYGSYVHLGPERLDRVSGWFTRYGNGLLVVAYFIPGVRHVTGYFSGITKIPYKRFAANAYVGALLWSGTFISLGRVLGPNWEKFHGSIIKYLLIVGVAAAVVLIGLYAYQNYRSEIIESLFKTLEGSVEIFQSLGKIRMAMLGVAAAFIGLSILVAGLIQDVLANEFGRFDMIAAYIVGAVIPQNWAPAMAGFRSLTAYPALALVTGIAAAWILFRGRNRLLEIRFLVVAVLGGEVLEEMLRTVFHRLGPWGFSIAAHARYTFPSESSLMAVVVYGFAAFLVWRHARKRWLGRTAIATATAICLLAGLGPLFFGVQFPSDVAAGYAFGGLWLSLNIILLEVFRILPEIPRVSR